MYICWIDTDSKESTRTRKSSRSRPYPQAWTPTDIIFCFHRILIIIIYLTPHSSTATKVVILRNKNSNDHVFHWSCKVSVHNLSALVYMGELTGIYLARCYRGRDVIHFISEFDVHVCFIHQADIIRSWHTPPIVPSNAPSRLLRSKSSNSGSMLQSGSNSNHFGTSKPNMSSTALARISPTGSNS